MNVGDGLVRPGDLTVVHDGELEVTLWLNNVRGDMQVKDWLPKGTLALAVATAVAVDRSSLIMVLVSGSYGWVFRTSLRRVG